MRRRGRGFFGSRRVERGNVAPVVAGARAPRCDGLDDIFLITQPLALKALS